MSNLNDGNMSLIGDELPSGAQSHEANESVEQHRWANRGAISGSERDQDDLDLYCSLDPYVTSLVGEIVE